MQITATDAVDLLLASGLPVEVKSFSDVKVAEHNLRVRVRQSPPAPSALKSHGAEGVVLYVVPRMTDGLRKLASEDPRIAFAAIQEGIVIFNGRQLEPYRADEHDQKAHPRRTPWVKFALIRALVRTARARTQTELANEVGATQAAISMQLRGMSADVRRNERGWVAVEPLRLAREFLKVYPGPKGISQHWYSHAPVMEQVRRVNVLAPDALISGDAGADRIAPWRSPHTAVVYARSGLALADHGFAEADSNSASLTVTVPADPTIWPTAEAYRVRTVVDPLICAYDVARAGGSDAEESVDRLLRDLIGSWQKVD